MIPLLTKSLSDLGLINFGKARFPSLANHLSPTGSLEIFDHYSAVMGFRGLLQLGLRHIFEDKLFHATAEQF
jgi:hypothetical protein